jgi:hypothetical protein
MFAMVDAEFLEVHPTAAVKASAQHIVSHGFEGVHTG